jgi:hypothetical protein
MNSGAIHALGRAGFAHSRMTSVKHESTRTSKCRALWRRERVSRNWSSGRMPRDSGDHHASSGSLLSGTSSGIGKIPRR